MFSNAVMTQPKTWNDVLGHDARGPECTGVGLSTCHVPRADVPRATLSRSFRLQAEVS